MQAEREKLKRQMGFQYKRKYKFQVKELKIGYNCNVQTCKKKHKAYASQNTFLIHCLSDWEAYKDLNIFNYWGYQQRYQFM